MNSDGHGRGPGYGNIGLLNFQTDGSINDSRDSTFIIITHHLTKTVFIIITDKM